MSEVKVHDPRQPVLDEITVELLEKHYKAELKACYFTQSEIKMIMEAIARAHKHLCRIRPANIEIEPDGYGADGGC